MFRLINEWLAIGNNKYIIYIKHVVKHPRRIMAGFEWYWFSSMYSIALFRTNFLPIEDQGYFTVELELPETATGKNTYHN